jgi:hypothetical protein
MIIAIVVTLAGGISDSYAGNKLLLAPLSGDNAKPLNNIITVAKANGDFTDPIKALASITDASESNRYLLIIGAGEFSLSGSLIMKSNVNIVGSGQALTTLIGAVSSNDLSAAAAFVVTADSTRLEGLSIINLGGPDIYCFGIANGQIGQSATTEIVDVKVDVSGCGQVRGVLNIVAKSSFKNLTVNAVDGSGSSIGMDSTISEIVISRSVISATGGSANIGIRNTTSSLTFRDSTIKASGGGTQIGFINGSDQSFARISNSQILATPGTSIGSGSIKASSGSGVSETYVANSSLEGLVTGDPKCSFVFLSNGNPLGPACGP